MNKEKTTQKDYFKMVLNVITKSDCDNKDELVDFILHRIELLDRKSSKVSSVMAQVNNELTEMVLHELEYYTDGVTATDLLNNSEMLSKYAYTEKGEEKVVTNQKLASILKKLVDSNIVNKEIIKKKSYFKLANNE